MDNSLISIVMPAKNAEAYITECIKSILEQEEVDWELIVVNDNSTDGTKAIVEDFTKKDRRISIFDNQGDGIISALKTGYRHVKGAYITRMDADDIMPVCKLKELKSELIKVGKGGLSTGLVKYFPSEKIGEGYKKYEAWLNNLCKSNNHFNEIYKECVIASPCWMIHKEDFDEIGAFDSTMYPEDYELVFRFYKKGLNISASDQVLHLWRDHPDRASRNHENYAIPYFFELKMTYFLELDFDKSKELIVWGTGEKGKIIANILQSKGIEFSWMCDNERKFGVDIKGVIIESFGEIKNRKYFKLIIAVAQRDAQAKIRAFLKGCNLIQNEDYFFFC
ncbi:MAG: glycosyltransferase family 2 protein [Bacteroidetes bacterium]|nr:glycosyltransferase family 2 protein [Bacteroidota bacterium]